MARGSPSSSLKVLHPCRHDCNVCKQPYTCPPPTRHELMQSFTGVEIASLIGDGCVIGAGREFSAELNVQLSAMPRALRHASSSGPRRLDTPCVTRAD